MALHQGVNPDAFDLGKIINPGAKAHPGGELVWYSYEGSLTEPPCTEGITWFVASKPVTASREEIRFFKNSIHRSESSRFGNNRETQELNGRPIYATMANFQDGIDSK